MEERKLCPLRYYANCVSTMLTVLILHNVESVYFFYSNPVFYLFIMLPIDKCETSVSATYVYQTNWYSNLKVVKQVSLTVTDRHKQICHCECIHSWHTV